MPRRGFLRAAFATVLVLGPVTAAAQGGPAGYRDASWRKSSAKPALIVLELKTWMGEHASRDSDLRKRQEIFGREVGPQRRKCAPGRAAVLDLGAYVRRSRKEVGPYRSMLNRTRYPVGQKRQLRQITARNAALGEKSRGD
jgi:hypothetical protein